MEQDGIYRPQRVIKDVYEDGIDTQHIYKLGLSPYARIGSLTNNFDEYNTITHTYRQWTKPEINLHRFTYIGPLTGETLSPSDRGIDLKAIIPNQSFTDFIKITPTPIVATLGLLKKVSMSSTAREQYLTKYQKDILWSTSAVPAFLTVVSILLIIYASITAPPGSNTSQPGNNGGGYSNGVSGGPNIIDNRLLFPLAGLLGSSYPQSTINAYGASTPSYLFTRPNTSPSFGAATPPSSTSITSPQTLPTSQSVTPSTMTAPLTTSTPSYSSINSPTNTSSILPTTSTPTTSSTLPSTSTTTTPTASTTNIPGVTTPISTSTPSTSLSNPLTNKPLISTTPTTITLN